MSYLELFLGSGSSQGGGDTVNNYYYSATDFETVQDLLASNNTAKGEGAIWTAGSFAYREAASGETDHDVENAAGLKLYALPLGNDLYLEAFGVVGNKTIGVSASSLTDYSAIVKKARDKALANNLALIFPSGAIKVVDGYCLLDINYSGRKEGYKIKGSTMFESIVFYEPLDASESLFYNNNSTIGVQIEDISFKTATSNAVFWDSYGNGVSQGHIFTNVNWGGSWVNLFKLSKDPADGVTTGNNNSEYKFLGCRTGIYNNNFTFLYGNSSDQNLNYWFINCSLWGDVCMAEMNSGGHVHVVDCDVSGYEPSSAQYLFKLNNTGHARGVLSLTVRGLRVEAKSENALILNSNWGDYGTISIRDLDTSSQAGNVTPVSPMLYFNANNNRAPLVTIESSAIMGQIQFNSAVSTFDKDARAVIRDTSFINYSEPEEAILTTYSINKGSIWSVELENCRSELGNTRLKPWSCNLGYLRGGIAFPKKRIAFFKEASGNVGASGSSITVTIPTNSIIVSFCGLLSAGATGSTATADYILKNADGDTVSAVQPATGLNVGFNERNDIQYLADTQNKRTLTLEPQSSVNVNTPSSFWIEYLA